MLSLNVFVHHGGTATVDHFRFRFWMRFHFSAAIPGDKQKQYDASTYVMKVHDFT